MKKDYKKMYEDETNDILSTCVYPIEEEEWWRDYAAWLEDLLERSDNNDYAKEPSLEASADRMAKEISALVKRDVISSRSPAADALLDYKDGSFV